MPSDSGICCAFNSELALKDSEYKDLVDEMAAAGSQDKTLWKARSGMKSGLSVTLDQHSDETTFGTVITDSNAFKIFIGSPPEFPVLQRTSRMAQPGKRHHFQVTGGFK